MAETNERNKIKKIQSRLKRQHEISKTYQEIKEVYDSKEEPTEEEIVQIIASQIKSESLAKVQPIESAEILNVEIEPMIERSVTPEVSEEKKGEIELAEVEKAELVESTAKKAGFNLYKPDIQAISRQTPNSYANRREMVSFVLQTIKNYVAEEDAFLRNEIESIHQSINESDRTVFNLLNNLSSSVEESATDYKSCGEELAKAFGELTEAFKAK
jgi:hypothetical protein